MTGGSGFLGGWCIAALLDRGYSVRTTVRDLAREDHVRAQVAAAGVDAGDRLDVLAADLNADGVPDLVIGAEDGHLYYLRNPRNPRTR